MNRTDFNALMLESVDEVLLVLGERGRTSLYFQVENRFQIRREEIPESVDEFHKSLVYFFAGGSTLLENMMAKELYKRIGLTYTFHNEWTLVEYTQEAKKQHKTPET